MDDDPAHDGTRAIPSLRYAQFAGRFTEHTVDDEETHGVDGGPTGGFTWDGRADTAREQARIPLFDAREMANADAAALARRVAAAPYAAQFRRAFSAPRRDVFADPQQVVAWMALAFEVFEQAPEFAPFDSRYDRFLAGRATLSPAELRGLALYRDPAKGNCDTCHPSRRASSGRAPLFTDAGFIAVGAPRRARLPPLAASAAVAIRSPSQARGAEADLGLCRSGRPGLSRRPELLRTLSHAHAAQRGAAHELLPQRLGALAARRRRLLCHARHRPRALVLAERRRQRARLRRPARRHGGVRRTASRRSSRCPTAARGWTSATSTTSSRSWAR